MNGLIKVQDTKRPNREPFEVSPEGLKGLQQKFGNRYQPLKQIVIPEKLKVEVVKPLVKK